MRIGFIGLGTMGRGMAANIQRAGYDMVVNDLNLDSAKSFIEKGAVWAETPAALAQQCDVIFTSLPTPADVQAVADTLGDALREGTAWFDLSTNSVDGVRSLAASFAQRGVAFLDAPVSGGPAGAASGNLAIWVGGDKDAFDRFEPVLSSMSDALRYIGPIGAGTIAKLTHNMASAALSSVMAEVFSMGVKAGVDPLPLWAAIRQGATGRQRTFERIGGRFLAQPFDTPSFALRLIEKDVKLALKLGNDVGVPMRICELVGQDLHESMERGWGGRDAHSYMLLQWERAGLPALTTTADDVKAIEAEG
ncbi:NAD(P)-dependent oxidoreductase [Sphingobium sp. H39-3-25]|uniref:NAD(P)-dependent oxidoreductase n=1 Tax=Sphingobium arseniciresistens TaxID=3030834 RepID=UPI0023B9088D|nr:NAD(P)-dependent oxidoreductase [Sphingobium arseniciresistens]